MDTILYSHIDGCRALLAALVWTWKVPRHSVSVDTNRTSLDEIILMYKSSDY